MFQASIPAAYWVKVLHTATYLLNLRPTKALPFNTSHFVLFGVHPDLSHLCVFGCKCYPNLAATAAHKLTPDQPYVFSLVIQRSTRAIVVWI
jgi:hypothetical protein